MWFYKFFIVILTSQIKKCFSSCNYYSLSILNSTDLVISSVPPTSYIPTTGTNSTGSGLIVQWRRIATNAPTLSISNGGSGYTGSPSFIIYSATGGNAVFTANLSGDTVNSASIDSFTDDGGFVTGTDYEATEIVSSLETVTQNTAHILSANEVLKLKHSGTDDAYGVVSSVAADGTTAIISGMVAFESATKIAKPF